MWDIIIIMALTLVYSLIKIHITLFEIKRRLLILEDDVEKLNVREVTICKPICPKCHYMNTIMVLKFDVSVTGKHISTAYECSECGYKFRVKIEDDKFINTKHR